MAKTKAKKVREKRVREGRRNPEESRSPFILADMRTRKTKTKKDYLYKGKYKNQSSQAGNDGSFYFGLAIFHDKKKENSHLKDSPPLYTKRYFSNLKIASPIPRSVSTSIITSASS